MHKMEQYTELHLQRTGSEMQIVPTPLMALQVIYLFHKHLSLTLIILILIG